MTTQRKLKQWDKLTNFNGDIAEIVAFDTESIFVRFVSNMEIENGKWELEKTAARNPKQAARVKTQLLFNKGILVLHFRHLFWSFFFFIFTSVFFLAKLFFLAGQS